MSTRAQLHHALIDVTFPSKPKIKALRAEHGPIAELLYIRLILVLSAATDGVARRSVAYSEGVEIGLTRPEVDTIVNYLVSDDMLAVTADLMSQDRVIKDQEKLQTRRDAEAKRQAEWRERERLKKEQEGRDTPVTLCVTQRENADSSEPDTGSDLKNKNGHPEPAVLEPLDDPKFALAEKEFEPPGEQPWARSNLFINAGLRPMRRYPEIWLSVGSLVYATDLFKRSNLEKDDRLRVFERTVTHARKQIKNGVPVERYATSCESWLTGFCFQEVLEEVTKRKRMERVSVGYGPPQPPDTPLNAQAKALVGMAGIKST